MWEGSGYEATPGVVEELLGPARARLLDALRSPATTSALALRFGVTPSAFSQYLALLHRSGVVDRERSGRRVLYQASELGLARCRGRSREGGRLLRLRDRAGADARPGPGLPG